MPLPNTRRVALTQPRILIIDDNDAARDTISAVLRERYAVGEAPSVAAALAALSVAPHGYAAVVLDLRLDAPCAPLHARLDALRVPVLVVSGLDEAAVRDAATLDLYARDGFGGGE